MGPCVTWDLGSKYGLATCKAGKLLNPCPSSQIILTIYILYPGFEKRRHILVVQILGVWGVWPCQSFDVGMFMSLFKT